MRVKTNDYLVIAIIASAIGISIAGIRSFNINNSYEVINQYGDIVKMWGSGIYKHDSFFKAPILIGTDYAVLFVLVPMLIVALFREVRQRNVKTKLILTSLVATSLYYSTSIVFGVTYNALQLLYILLFSCTFFTFIRLTAEIDRDELKKKSGWKLPSKGITVFLYISGISLLIAWLPDIIPTLLTGNSLSLIEVYTTEITYVLDMGIVSPVIFICLYQLKQQNPFGLILLAIILKTCEIIGIMLFFQSVCQALAGIEIPAPVLITKVGIFVLLAGFSMYFNRKLYRNMEE